MANYDQSGNPLGGERNMAQQGGQQQGAGSASGQAGAGSAGQAGQQSQYSTRGQGQERGMQQTSGHSMTSATGGFFPDFYSGFGGGPFALISRLSDEMDRIFENFGLPSGWTQRGTGQRGMTGQGSNQGLRALWAPHIEVAEREGKLLIQADLPGVRKEDVSVQLENDAVVIQGHRHQENERNEQGFYHSERSYGTFYRMIPLPEGIDVDQANATFRDGVLRIELPAPQPQQRGRRLEIRDESGQQGQPGQRSGTATGGQGAQASQHTSTQAGATGQQGSQSGSSTGGQQGAGERR